MSNHNAVNMVLLRHDDQTDVRMHDRQYCLKTSFTWLSRVSHGVLAGTRTQNVVAVSSKRMLPGWSVNNLVSRLPFKSCSHLNSFFCYMLGLAMKFLTDVYGYVHWETTTLMTCVVRRLGNSCEYRVTSADAARKIHWSSSFARNRHVKFVIIDQILAMRYYFKKKSNIESNTVRIE